MAPTTLEFHHCSGVVQMPITLLAVVTNFRLERPVKTPNFYPFHVQLLYIMLGEERICDGPQKETFHCCFSTII